MALNSFKVKDMSTANGAHSRALMVNIKQILLVDPKFVIHFEIVFGWKIKRSFTLQKYKSNTMALSVLVSSLYH